MWWLHDSGDQSQKEVSEGCDYGWDRRLDIERRWMCIVLMSRLSEENVIENEMQISDRVVDYW